MVKDAGERLVDASGGLPTTRYRTVVLLGSILFLMLIGALLCVPESCQRSDRLLA
jgi:hypothetical protein